MNPFKVLVCGGRHYADRGAVFAFLDDIANGGRIHIVQGGAEGADGLAREWALSRCVPLTTYPADWRKGKAAGPIRNTQMLTDENPSLVIAFPGGKGTADMIAKAKAKGVKVIEHPPTPLPKSAVEES